MKLAWTGSWAAFLAAPADRRHVFIGQLESAWPVFNVATDGERLYCSAGRFEQLDGGIHFYALDPATDKMHWHVKWVSGLSSDKFTPREMQKVVDEKTGKAGSFDPERNKRIINDIIEVRDGKVWLFEMPVVDLADPKDTIINPETLVPPQFGMATKSKPVTPADR